MPDTERIISAFDEMSKRVDKLAVEAHALSLAHAAEREERRQERRERLDAERRRHWLMGGALLLCILFMLAGAVFFGAGRNENQAASNQAARTVAEMCRIENQAARGSYERTVSLLEAVKGEVPDPQVTAVVDNVLAALPVPVLRECQP